MFKKSKKSSMMMSNIAGMISGMMLGVMGVFMLKKYQKNHNTLRFKAKKAFKTIEDKISV